MLALVVAADSFVLCPVMPRLVALATFRLVQQKLVKAPAGSLLSRLVRRRVVRVEMLMLLPVVARLEQAEASPLQPAKESKKTVAS
jgi:hypothetical protein